MGTSHTHEAEFRLFPADPSVKKPKEHQALIDFFADEWSRRHGTKYPVTGRDTRATKTILKHCPSNWRVVLMRYLEDRDRFVVKMKHPLYHLGDNLQRWIVVSGVETKDAIAARIDNEK